MTKLQYNNARMTLESEMTCIQNSLIEANKDLKRIKDLHSSVHDKVELLTTVIKHNSILAKRVTRCITEYGKLENTLKKNKEIDSILNRNWNLTNDERIDELDIREEVKALILIDQFRTENQEPKTKIKEMDKILSPFKQCNVTTKSVLSTFLSNILENQNNDNNTMQEDFTEDTPLNQGGQHTKSTVQHQGVI